MTSEQDVPHESGQGKHASPAPWLLDEAVEPFEAKALHPTGGAHGAAGDKVKCAAHAERDANLFQAVAVASNPFVLLGCAIGDHEQIGLAVVDHLDDCAVFLFGGCASTGARYLLRGAAGL